MTWTGTMRDEIAALGGLPEVMTWTGTMRDEIAALGGLPEERESELFQGMWEYGLSVVQTVRCIKAGVPIAYAGACGQSWTVEQVLAAWEEGLPIEYVKALGSASQEGAS